MNIIKKLLVFLIGISIISIGLSYAQPNLPRENIPSGTPDDIKTQIERLYSPDPVERAYGAIELSRMGERARPAVPFLIGILHDTTPLAWSFRGSFPRSPSTSPGSEAAKALGEIKDSRAVDPLLEVVLKHKDEYVRDSAARALGKIKDPLAVESLISFLHDENKSVRSAAVIALGEAKDLRAVEPLIAALKDKDSDVRMIVVEALMKIKDPRVVKPLISALKDKNASVRRNAEIALVKIGKPTVDLLIAALMDTNADIRRKAAYMLADIKDPRAIGPLIVVLQDNDKDVQLAATYALQQITGQDLGEDPVKWQEWWEENKAK